MKNKMSFSWKVNYKGDDFSDATITFCCEFYYCVSLLKLSVYIDVYFVYKIFVLYF